MTPHPVTRPRRGLPPAASWPVALLLSLALAPSVAAASLVDGCDVTLTPPDPTAVWADVQRLGDDGWTQLPVEDGVVDATAAGTGQLAPGDYVVTWRGGGVEGQGVTETFTLDCEPFTAQGDAQPSSANDGSSWILPETSSKPPPAGVGLPLGLAIVAGVLAAVIADRRRQGQA